MNLLPTRIETDENLQLVKYYAQFSLSEETRAQAEQLLQDEQDEEELIKQQVEYERACFIRKG